MLAPGLPIAGQNIVLVSWPRHGDGQSDALERLRFPGRIAALPVEACGFTQLASESGISFEHIEALPCHHHQERVGVEEQGAMV